MRSALCSVLMLAACDSASPTPRQHRAEAAPAPVTVHELPSDAPSTPPASTDIAVIDAVPRERYGPSLAVNGGSALFVSYIEREGGDPGTYALKFARWTGVHWEIASVPSAFPPGTRPFSPLQVSNEALPTEVRAATTLALDAANRPSIVFNVFGGAQPGVYLATDGASGWRVNYVGGGTANGRRSLALVGASKFVLSCDASHRPTLSEWNAGHWSVQHLIDDATDCAGGSLFLDSRSRLHTTFVAATSATPALYYGRQFEGSMHVIKVPNEKAVLAPSDLVVDNAAAIHLTWLADGARRGPVPIHMAIRDRVAWECDNWSLCFEFAYRRWRRNYIGAPNSTFRAVGIDLRDHGRLWLVGFQGLMMLGAVKEVCAERIQAELQHGRRTRAERTRLEHDLAQCETYEYETAGFAPGESQRTASALWYVPELDGARDVALGFDAVGNVHVASAMWKTAPLTLRTLELTPRCTFEQPCAMSIESDPATDRAPTR